MLVFERLHLLRKSPQLRVFQKEPLEDIIFSGGKLFNMRTFVEYVIF